MPEYTFTSRISARYNNPNCSVFKGEKLSGVLHYEIEAETELDAMKKAEEKFRAEFFCVDELTDITKTEWTVCKKELVENREKSESCVYAGRPVNFSELCDTRLMLIDDIQDKLWNALNSIKDGYAILQANNNAANKFVGYNTAHKEGLDINVNNYDILWVEKCETDKTYTQRCDEIYSRFNRPDRPNHEKGFYGTSLSVSDVIILKTDGKMLVSYVDTFGFKTLDDDFFKGSDKKQKINHNIEKE